MTGFPFFAAAVANVVNQADKLDKSTGVNNGGSLSNASFWNGLGNAFTGNLDFKRDMQLQDIANSFTAMENQKARDFEERLSNTAYQRAVADMRAAGLNPYLLYNSGRSMQATTPSSSSASGQIPTRGHSGKGFDYLISLLPALLNFSAMRSNAILSANTSRDIAAIRAQSALDVQQMRYRIAKLYTGR